MKITLLLLGCASGYAFGIFWCKTTKPIQNLNRIGGYHFHHTLFIVPAILIAIFFKGDLSLFFLGGGVGAMVHDFLFHNKKLKFITKD